MTTSDSRRKSALHLAAENGNEAIVALLLAYGYDPNITVDLRIQGLKPNEINEWGQQDLDVIPSRLAAENGHLSVLNVLRVHGAKEKPISAACAHGHLEVVSWFLDCEVEKKASQTTFSPENREERSPYDEPTNNTFEYLQRYMRKSVDEHGYKHRGGVEGMLDELVKTAVEHGQLEILKMLVSRGAWLRTPTPRAQNVGEDAKTFNGSTILHDASKMGHGIVVEYLLSAEFDVNENRVLKNRTPLMEAARGGKYKVFKLLIEHDADIGAQDRDGRSIIMGAAEGGSIEIMSLLIDLGMDPTTTSTNLVSPLSTAIQHKQRPLAEFLLEKLTTSDAGVDHCHGVALRTAACHGYVDIVQELLKRGADPNFGTLSTSLSWLGKNVDLETNEADCIGCAQVLLAAGGKLQGVEGVLRRLDWAEKPALAAFLLENCLDESNTAGIHWLEHVNNARKRSQPKLLRLLSSQFCLVQDPEQDSPVFCHIVIRAVGAGQLEIVDILLQASSPQDASKYARAAISALGLRKQDHMRQYLEDRHLVVVDSGWGNWLGSIWGKRRLLS